MPTKKEIAAKKDELAKDSKYGTFSQFGAHLNKEGQAELDKFTKGAAAAPTAVNLKYSPDQRNQLTEQYNSLKNQIAELTQSKADRDKDFKSWSADRKKDYDSFIKDMTYETNQANKIKDRKEKANRLAEINTEKANRKKEYDAEIAARQKELADIPKTIAELNKQLKPLVPQYQAATKEYATTQAQAKKLGMDVGEYENQIFGQTKQRQEEADFAQVAAERGMTVEQLKQMQNQKQSDEALQQQEARKAEEDRVAAEAQAARQAQVQAQQRKMAELMAQRQGENYNQVYNLLTQNMPSPVGYFQGPTSREAQTTVIGAGGDQNYGQQQQMSPGQIAAMRGQFMAETEQNPYAQGMPPEMYQQGMPPQGMPPQGIAAAQQLTPQQIAAQRGVGLEELRQIAAMHAQQASQTQQAPVMAAYGGIMGRYK